MGADPRPAYDVPTRDLTEFRRDMWSWAEPVINDCAAASYDKALPSGLASSIMARKHCRVWQAVIFDQPQAIPELRDDVRRTGEKFGLPAELSRDVDGLLYDELVDIVLSRFRASRRTAEACGTVLKWAPTCLGAARAAA